MARPGSSSKTTPKPRQTHRAYTFDVGRGKADSLKEGPATVTLEAKANVFRGRSKKVVYPVQVILQKPSVSVDGAQHYINQGGSELVTFDIKGVWSQAGVKVGPHPQPASRCRASLTKAIIDSHFSPSSGNCR